MQSNESKSASNRSRGIGRLFLQAQAAHLSTNLTDPVEPQANWRLGAEKALCTQLDRLFLMARITLVHQVTVPMEV